MPPGSEMAEDNNSVLLTILNKSYRVNCPSQDRSALMEAARYLDERMYRIQSRGTHLDREQIAVMVSLNVAHELLKKQSGTGGELALDDSRISELEDKLDRAIAGSSQPAN